MNKEQIENLYNRLYNFSEVYTRIRNFKEFSSKMAKASKEDVIELNRLIEAKRTAGIKGKLEDLGVAYSDFEFEESLLGNELKKIKAKPLLEVWEDEKEFVSECCGATIIKGGFCSECKEHVVGEWRCNN